MKLVGDVGRRRGRHKDRPRQKEWLKGKRGLMMEGVFRTLDGLARLEDLTDHQAPLVK